MIELIGTNAGIVWQTLNKSKKPLTLKELKTNSGIRTEREVVYALGWLAKEGKLKFEGGEKDFTVTLV